MLVPGSWKILTAGPELGIGIRELGWVVSSNGFLATRMREPAMSPPNELNTAVHDALQSLSQSHKAAFLLDTALTLIQAGRYCYIPFPSHRAFLRIYFIIDMDKRWKSTWRFT